MLQIKQVGYIIAQASCYSNSFTTEIIYTNVQYKNYSSVCVRELDTPYFLSRNLRAKRHLKRLETPSILYKLGDQIMQ